MASQQKIAQAREQVENLRLRAAIRAGAPTGGDEIFRSNDSGAGDQALWQQLKNEEAAEAEKSRRANPYFSNLSATWSKPLAEILKMKSYALPLLLDVDANLPLQPVDKIDYSKSQATFNDFLELMKSKNQALSTSGQNKLITFAGIASQGEHVISGVSYSVDVSDINMWVRALNRLIDLNAFADDEYAALLEDEQQAPVEETTEDLRSAADSQWLRIFGTIYREWLASLAQSPWNFVPDEDQQRAALQYLEQRGVGTPLAFDQCRVAMSNAGIFPNLLTADDILCAKLDSGEWDLSTPAGRSAFQRATNQIRFGTLGE